jgi:hypothetical protein
MISTQSRLLHSVQHAKRSSSGQSEQLISSATVTHIPKAKARSRPWGPASGNAGLRGRRAGTARPLRRARGRAARRSRAGPGPCERPSRGPARSAAETRARGPARRARGPAGGSHPGRHRRHTVPVAHSEGEAMVLWQNSEALTALGRIAEAKHAAANAVSIAERVGRRGWTATALRSIGIAYEATGDLPTAEDAFRRFAPQEPASAAVFVLGTCATCPRTGGHGEAREGRHSCRSRACHGATSRPVRSTGRQMRARRRPSATEHLRDAPGCGAPRDRGRPSGQPGPSLHVDRFLGGGLEHSHSRRWMTRWTACLRARWCKLWHRCPRRTVRPPPCKAAPRQ